MKSLKIAYILLHFPYLTETFVAEEIRSLKSKGFNVRIFSLLEPGPGPSQPISQEILPITWYAPGMLSLRLWRAQIYYLLKDSRVFISLLLDFLRQPMSQKQLITIAKRQIIFLKAVAIAYELKDDEVHLLHTHFAWLSGGAAWICSKLLELPFTMTVHAFDLFVSNDLVPLLAKHASHIVAISEYNRRHVEEVVANSRKSISVIRCGVSLSRIKQNPMMGSQQSVEGPIRILSVGSLVRKKGHAHLISACKLLQDRDVSFKCTIIGAGSEEESLRQQIHDSGLSQFIKLLGAQPHPEILEAYSRNDLFVLASVESPEGDMDGIPVVLMEAGAAGLPLISTEISGIPELVHPGETGLLVTPGDPESLANAITDLADDGDLRTVLGQNARILVEAEFNLERNVDSLAALFLNTHKSWWKNEV